MNYELLAILVTVVLQALYFAHKMGIIEKSISSLEEKQIKHNNLIERTYCIERDVSILKEQIRVENHRIDDLKKGGNL